MSMQNILFAEKVQNRNRSWELDCKIRFGNERKTRWIRRYWYCVYWRKKKIKVCNFFVLIKIVGYKDQLMLFILKKKKG